MSDSKTRFIIPKVIALRGASAYAPENTLAAIRTAADIGATWIEIDVQTTRDDVPVLFLDENMFRTTGADRKVSETDFATLADMDAGTWYGDSFIGEKIPTLEDALALAQDLDLGVTMMIRPAAGREVSTAESVLDAATRIWDEDAQAPLVASFSHVTLETARDMMPEWKRGFLMDQAPDNWHEFVDFLDIYALHIDGAHTDDTMFDDYIESQKKIIAHGIDDPIIARNLIARGVDSFATSLPDVLRDAVEMLH